MNRESSDADSANWRELLTTISSDARRQNVCRGKTFEPFCQNFAKERIISEEFQWYYRFDNFEVKITRLSERSAKNPAKNQCLVRMSIVKLRTSKYPYLAVQGIETASEGTSSSMPFPSLAARARFPKTDSARPELPRTSINSWLCTLDSPDLPYPICQCLATSWRHANKFGECLVINGRQMLRTKFANVWSARYPMYRSHE